MSKTEQKNIVTNLNNSNSEKIIKNINELFLHVYKKKPSKKLEINVINITYPQQKVYKMDIKYMKNIKNMISYIFSNIDRKPFISSSYNINAFEILWIILSILDRAHGYPFRTKNLFVNLATINRVVNTIKFGKYIFAIPRYKRFIFEVKGFNLAKLRII